MRVKRILVYRKSMLNILIFERNINVKLNLLLVHLYLIINLLHEKNLNNKCKSKFSYNKITQKTLINFSYRDSQRKRKVQDIQSQLSMQEGEYRKLQKLK